MESEKQSIVLNFPPNNVKRVKLVYKTSAKSIISPPSQDYINTLPDEMLLEIFRYVPVCELGACAMVCKRWHKISSNKLLWKTLTLQSKRVHLKAFEQILNRVTTLKLAMIDFVIPADEPIFHNSRFNDLQYFFCEDYVDMGEFFEKLLLSAPNLKSFRARDSWAFAFSLSFKFFRHILKLKFLEELELPFVKFKKPVDERVSQFSSIIHVLQNSERFGQLRLFSFYGLINVEPEIHALFLEKFLHLCPYLTSLNLRNISFSAAVFSQILKMKNLECLTLRDITVNSPLEVLTNHESFHQLKYLYFGYSRYCVNFFDSHNAGIVLKACPTVKELSLEDCRINHEILSCIGVMTELKSLEFVDTPDMSENSFYSTFKNIPKLSFIKQR